MAHEGSHEQADDSRPPHEREGQPQGKAAGYQPEHVPAHFLQVFPGDGFRNGKDGDGNHGDGIGVQPVHALTRYPQ